MFTTLVSTETLAEHLDGSRLHPGYGGQAWVVVDCRYDLTDHGWGREQYRAGHIPGAVYASLSEDLSGPPSGTNGRHPLPCVEDVEATFGRLGIAPGTQVAVYDQDAGMYASRLWWMLRYLGHDAVAVVDGGWAKWVREGRPVRAGEETRPAAVFRGQRRKEMRMLVDQVERLIGSSDVVLVDARGPERFEGASEPLDRAAGHIPGAVNHFYRRNVAEDGVLRPPDELRRLFADTLGGRPPDRAVTYCGSGVTACHNLLAMEHAGLRGTKLYAGSWSEWSSDPARPVETGPSVTRKPS